MKKSARRFWTVAAICGGTTLLVALLYGYHLETLLKLEFYTQDVRMRQGQKTPVDTNLVLIGIDRPTYASSAYFNNEEIAADPTLKVLQGNFPWSRAVWARVIQRLGDAGARVIALDLSFAAEGDGDGALKQVLDDYKDRVVIGSNIREPDSDRGTSMTLDVPNSSVLNTTNVPESDDRVGYVNIWPDPDGVLRRARYRLDSASSGDLIPAGTVMESLAARVLRKYGKPDAIPAGFEAVRFRYTLAPGFGYRVHPLGEILAPKIWRENYQNGEFFRGKVVLIGPTADIFQDRHATPFTAAEETGAGRTKEHSGEMLGPEIHLNIIGAALHGGFLKDSGRRGNQLIVVLAGLAAFGMCLLVRKPLLRLAAMFLLCAAYWYMGQSLFNRAGLVIPVAVPLLVLIFSGVLVLGYDYFLEQFERARTRKTLERYVSKNIVKELLDNPATYFNALGGVRRPVTILFSDVRGFTTLTESADSAQLVKQLNEYFEQMVNQVFGFQGTLDKFIGDAVMAVWGNMVTQGPERDAQNAVDTALAMKQSLAELNADWKKRGMLELAFGIGINHGEVIVGNLGSTEKMELTVIGDAVNLASRLESLTKQYHLDLLIGETVAPLVRDKFLLRTVDFVQVKGKTKPVDVFTVMGERGGKMNDIEDGWLQGYEEGVKLYRQRKFSEAAQKFGNCLRVKPDDYLCSMYGQRCEALIQNPPGESWDGVFVMKDK